MAKIQNNKISNTFKKISVNKNNIKNYKKIESDIENTIETKKDTYEAETTSFMYLQGKVLKYAHAQGPLLGASALGAGYASYNLAKMSKAEAKEAIKHKSLHHGAEAVAFAGASAVSGATAVNGAVHLATEVGLKESIAHPLLHGAHSVMSAAGTLYGGVEVGLGAYDIAKGIKTKDKEKVIKGTLNIASGGLVVALSTIGLGLPGAIALAGVEVVKMLHDRHLTPKQAIKLAYNKVKNFSKETKDKILSKFKIKDKKELIKESHDIGFHIADKRVKNKD